MKASFIFEWRRLKASFVLSLLVALVIIASGIYFWMTGVRQQQMRQTLMSQTTKKQATLNAASTMWAYVTHHPSENSPAEIVVAKQKLVVASQLDRNYRHQKRALKQRNSPDYMKSSLKAFAQEKKLTHLSPLDFRVDLKTNREQTIRFRQLLADRQGYELNGYATSMPVFMTDFSGLLSNWFLILLVVMIVSTTWTLSWFGRQHEWVQLNLPHEYTWAATNFLMAWLVWLTVLLLALSMGFVLSQRLGQPLLSGSHNWQNVATNVPRPLCRLFQANVCRAVWRFGLVYFIWQSLSRIFATFGRGLDV